MQKIWNKGHYCALGHCIRKLLRIISFDKEPVIIRQEEHLFSGTIR